MGQGVFTPHVMIAQAPWAVQRRAPPQSALVVQSRTHEPNMLQLVPEGQSLMVPQPPQMPPGAVAVHVLMPGQSALVRH